MEHPNRVEAIIRQDSPSDIAEGFQRKSAVGISVTMGNQAPDGRGWVTGNDLESQMVENTWERQVKGSDVYLNCSHADRHHTT